MQEFLANNNILMLIPYALFSLAGFYLLFADLFKDSKILEKILFVLSLLFCIYGAGLYIPYLRDESRVFFSHSMFVCDPFNTFLNILIIVILAFTVVISKDFLSRFTYRHGEYYSLLFFSALGMLLLTSANNLLIVFLGLEIMSIPLYILSGFLKDDLKSKEAAMKYFILGAFSTGIFAMGVAFVYGSSGSLDLNEISTMGRDALNFTLFLAGLGLILIGLGFKIALVPFHMWVPDVYEGAPTSVVAFMSVTVKIATFAAFVRIFVFSLSSYSMDLVPVLKILAILSMTLGNFAAIYQSNIKRMLAYSSIAHAGYILIAVISSRGEAAQVGISALIFYLVAYSIMKLGAFSVVSFFEGKEGSGTKIEDYSEIGYKYPFLGLAMTVFMLSLAGIPLTAGFMGKLYVFGSAVKSGYLDLAIIGVINSLISVYYYLRVIVYMYMKKSEVSFTPKANFGTAVVIGISMFLIIIFGIYPEILLDFTDFISYIVS